MFSTVADQEGEGSSDCLADPVLVIAALETRVREDGSWERHAQDYLPHPCGHLRSLRKVIVTVARALIQGESGGFERPLTTWCRVCGLLGTTAVDTTWQGTGQSSDCPFPTLDQMPIGAPFVASPVIARHEEVAALEAARSQLKSPTAEATLKVKNQHLASDYDSSQQQARAAVKQAIQVKQQGQSSKGQRAKGKGQTRRGKLRLGRDILVRPARPRDCLRQFPRHQSG